MLRSLSNSFLNNSFLRSSKASEEVQQQQDEDPESPAAASTEPSSAPRSILKKRASHLFGSGAASGTPTRNVTFSESTTDFCPAPAQRLFDNHVPPTFYKHSEVDQKQVIVDDVGASEEEEEEMEIDHNNTDTSNLEGRPSGLGASALPEDSLASFQHRGPPAAEWSNLLDASLGPAITAAGGPSSLSASASATSDHTQDHSDSGKDVLSNMPFSSPLHVPKRRDSDTALTQLQSSQTMTPGSAPRRLKAARRPSTTPVRSPSPLESLSHEQDASVYHSAPREASVSFADESEFPDPESSPSHRGQHRRKLSFTQSNSSNNNQVSDSPPPKSPAHRPPPSPAHSSPDRSAQQHYHHFGKVSLSTVMDDSPTHESERFSFSSMDDSASSHQLQPEQNTSLEDIRLDSPTPSPNSKRSSTRSPSAAEPGPTEEAQAVDDAEDEDEQTAVVPASASASLHTNKLNLSIASEVQSNLNSSGDDLALAADLEALLAAQTELISAGQFQRSSLLSLIRKMQSHIRGQNQKMADLEMEKDEADAGWAAAIDQVEAWEVHQQQQRPQDSSRSEAEYLDLAQSKKALQVQLGQVQHDASLAWEQLDQKQQEFKLLSERVEWQEAEARSQSAKAKEAEVELKRALEAEFEQTLAELEQALHEAEEAKDRALDEQAQSFNTQLDEAKQAALAEIERQVAENESQTLQQLDAARQELSRQHEEEVRSLTEQLDEAHTQLATSEESQRLLKADLERETMHRQRTDEALKASEAQREDVAAELAEVEADFARSRQESESVERECRFEIDSLRKRLCQAQDDIARAEEGATGQLDVLSRHQNRVEELEEQLRQGRSEAEQVRQQWQDEVRVLERQAQDAQKEVRELRAEHETQDHTRAADTQTLRAEVERLKTLVGQLRMQSSDSDVKVSRLQKIRQTLLADKESLEVAIDAKQMEIDYLKRKKSSRASTSMGPSTTATNQTTLAVDLPSIQDTPLPVQQRPVRRSMQSTVKKDPIQPQRLSFNNKKSAAEGILAAREARRSVSGSLQDKENHSGVPSSTATADAAPPTSRWSYLKERKSLTELPSTTTTNTQPSKRVALAMPA